MLNLIIYSSLILAAAIWYEHLSGVNIFDKIRGALGAPPYWREGDKVTFATRGPFGGKIIMAQYFSLVAFLAFSRILAAGNLKNTIKWAVAFFFIFMALFFTLTRISIVSVATVLLLATFFLNLRILSIKKAIKIILIIVFFATLAVYLTPRFIDINRIVARFGIVSQLNDPEVGSVSGHIYSLKAIMPAMLKLDKFMLGYGPGVVEKYRIVGSEMVETAGLDYVYGWGFTIYHVFMLESGIFGILLFMLILGFSFTPLVKTARRERDDKRKKFMAYGLFLAFVAYSLSMLGSHSKDTLFLFFALLGIAPAVAGERVSLLKLY